MSDSREHIIMSSMQLFLQKGFKEVTMKEIVDKTGLSKGAFYHYFSSKEQVFQEVIAYFLDNAMVTKFKLLPDTSLKEFYEAVLNDFEKGMSNIGKLVSKDKDQDEKFNSNFYYLIFDAIRILPDFKEKAVQQQKEEIQAWKKVIAAAKKSGEINTTIPDEQLAKLFIFSGDGLSINQIMVESVVSGRKRNELKQIWSSLYEQLKA
jgi:TetR/AcrR family transcriptional regulator, transcriptional repressor for nem operon